MMRRLEDLVTVLCIHILNLQFLFIHFVKRRSRSSMSRPLGGDE